MRKEKFKRNKEKEVLLWKERNKIQGKLEWKKTEEKERRNTTEERKTFGMWKFDRKMKKKTKTNKWMKMNPYYETKESKLKENE